MKKAPFRATYSAIVKPDGTTTGFRKHKTYEVTFDIVTEIGSRYVIVERVEEATEDEALRVAEGRLPFTHRPEMQRWRYDVREVS